VSGERFPWTRAKMIAEELCYLLKPSCARIEIAGSIRRKKPDVGDIEILYIPFMRTMPDPADLFATIEVNLADRRIRDLEEAKVLERRLNVKGRETFGDRNKLVRHVVSGIPVDLFAATEENWFNYLVCRTGPAELNQRIASAAIAIGWQWNPYGPGFTAKDNGQVARMETEEDVFDFVGIPYVGPDQR
jgi:DNA polymerase/3'-5' exonuclease PolX